MHDITDNPTEITHCKIQTAREIWTTKQVATWTGMQSLKENVLGSLFQLKRRNITNG